MKDGKPTLAVIMEIPFFFLKETLGYISHKRLLRRTEVHLANKSQSQSSHNTKLVVMETNLHQWMNP
jgi:hypothetical protein